jgi:hypothetical protein
MDPLKYMRKREAEEPEPSGVRYVGNVLMMGGAFVTVVGGVLLFADRFTELLGLGPGLMMLGYVLGVLADLLGHARPKD